MRTPAAEVNPYRLRSGGGAVGRAFRIAAARLASQHHNPPESGDPLCPKGHASEGRPECLPLTGSTAGWISYPAISPIPSPPPVRLRAEPLSHRLPLQGGVIEASTRLPVELYHSPLEGESQKPSRRRRLMRWGADATAPRCGAGVFWVHPDYRGTVGNGARKQGWCVASRSQGPGEADPGNKLVRQRLSTA